MSPRAGHGVDHRLPKAPSHAATGPLTPQRWGIAGPPHGRRSRSLPEFYEATTAKTNRQAAERVAGASAVAGPQEPLR